MNSRGLRTLFSSGGRDSLMQYVKKTKRQGQYEAPGSILLQTVGSAIHVTVTVKHVAYLNIFADKVNPLLETVFPGGSGLF